LKSIIKTLTALFLLLSLTGIVLAQEGDKEEIDEVIKEVTRQETEKKGDEKMKPVWEFGAGLRLNYLGLSGGITGYSAEQDVPVDIDYREIGMDNYAPSLALAMAGKYKKFNLFFGASKGSYKGSFITKNDLVHEDELIPAGSEVDGNIRMGIYSLSTTFAIVQRQHDLGAGLGVLLLDMGMEFKTDDVTIGSDQVFPMPFLALSGRLNFGRLKFVGVGGGAYFGGKMDGYDYTVYYYTIDVKVAYDIIKTDNWATILSLGYRNLVMDSKASKEGSWFREKDKYQGLFLSVTQQFSSY